MSQDREFVATVVRSLPEPPEDVKQGWIENPQGLAKVLREVLCPSKWHEKDGVIYFTVVSDGTTGEEWITWLETNGFRASKYAKSVLLSPDFVPTTGVAYQVAVLKGKSFSDKDRVTSMIRAEAASRSWNKPPAELACLIRKKFSDEDLKAMGLWWIVTFHEPIKDSDGRLSLLAASRRGDGRWLDACYDCPDCRWGAFGGFAFVVPQVS